MYTYVCTYKNIYICYKQNLQNDSSTVKRITDNKKRISTYLLIVHFTHCHSLFSGNCVAFFFKLIVFFILLSILRILLNKMNKWQSHPLVKGAKCLTYTILPEEQTDDQVLCKHERSSSVCFPAVLWHLGPSVTQHSTQAIKSNTVTAIHHTLCTYP